MPTDPNDYKRNKVCRICGGSDLVPVLDLGATPPANAYLRKEDLDAPEPTFPLGIHFCKDCTLVQVLDVVNPEILFKNYHYVTAASQPTIVHFKKYSEDAIRPFLTSKDDLVVDIGGNDGLLLSFIKDEARVLNVDPADNLAPLSEEKGVPFHTAFFTSDIADELIVKYGHAKVITANNVFAHTDPLRDVFNGVAKFLAEDGVFVFEVHWVKNLIEQGCFDQIYHEHLCFHSLHALKYLVEASGMSIFDVEIVPMQGQSLRVYVAKNRQPEPVVAQILAEEEVAGLTTEEGYQSFSDLVEGNKQKLTALLRELKMDGKKVVGYGAAAKAQTLLNYFDIGPETLDYLIDSTPLKQGLYSPGKHIPIVHPDTLKSDTPDYILLLVWNYADAILEKEKALREKGVKFIIPVPEVRII
jgi:hypothetical protein